MAQRMWHMISRFEMLIEFREPIRHAGTEEDKPG
jgi:hypothetical protein